MPVSGNTLYASGPSLSLIANDFTNGFNSSHGKKVVKLIPQRDQIYEAVYSVYSTTNFIILYPPPAADILAKYIPLATVPVLNSLIYRGMRVALPVSFLLASRYCRVNAESLGFDAVFCASATVSIPDIISRSRNIFFIV